MLKYHKKCFEIKKSWIFRWSLAQEMDIATFGNLHQKVRCNTSTHALHDDQEYFFLINKIKIGTLNNVTDRRLFENYDPFAFYYLLKSLIFQLLPKDSGNPLCPTAQFTKKMSFNSVLENSSRDFWTYVWYLFLNFC